LQVHHHRSLQIPGIRGQWRPLRYRDITECDSPPRHQHPETADAIAPWRSNLHDRARQTCSQRSILAHFRHIREYSECLLQPSGSRKGVIRPLPHFTSSVDKPLVDLCVDQKECRRRPLVDQESLANIARRGK
jgi:hypothetical protein